MALGRRQAVHHGGTGRSIGACRCLAGPARTCDAALLDTSLEENASWDRELTARLYGGDRETRIQQEIILGIGGVRAPKALGLNLAVPPERRPLPASWCSSASAISSSTARRSTMRRRNRNTTVFTTHTPVLAGHDRFRSAWSKTSASCWERSAQSRTVSRARSWDNGNGEQFNMTALAIRSAGSTSGQPAARHRHARDVRAVARHRRGGAPGVVGHQRRPRADVDRPDLALFTKHLGADWIERHDDPPCGRRARHSDEELWTVRQGLRRYLFAFIRERARQRWSKSTSGPRVVAAGTLLGRGAHAGFARRFAGYKRSSSSSMTGAAVAHPQRLDGRCRSFAGKAHPADDWEAQPPARLQARSIRSSAAASRLSTTTISVAFPGARPRCVAEQPAQTARGGGTSGTKAAERRAAPARRRVVGRGFTGANGWVIDGRAPAATWTPPTPRMRTRCIACSRKKSCRFFYDRDRRTHAPLDRHGEGVHRTVTPQFSARRMVKYARRMCAALEKRQSEI